MPGHFQIAIVSMPVRCARPASVISGSRYVKIFDAAKVSKPRVRDSRAIHDVERIDAAQGSEPRVRDRFATADQQSVNAAQVSQPGICDGCAAV